MEIGKINNKSNNLTLFPFHEYLKTKETFVVLIHKTTKKKRLGNNRFMHICISLQIMAYKTVQRITQ